LDAPDPRKDLTVFRSAPHALTDRVAIVTGAASGIGRASAYALAEAGAAVLVADLNGDGAERVADEIVALGGRAAGQHVDVAEESSIETMVDAAVERFGGLDILHNNAAEVSPSIMSRDLEVADLDAEVWDRTLCVNLRGPMLGCKHAIPRMLSRGGGSIVNTSSASGLTGDLTRAAYGASKAGLDSLTRYVATQYGKRGIRCNAIAPGVVLTPSVEANIPHEQVEMYLRSHLTPRLGSPEDIAAVVVFLASEASAFVTGQTLSVDGGLLAHHPIYNEVNMSMDGQAEKEQ
jgi:NAD(P)-dependent dehydrogenase (short-subunit alcohol dehydrogenase family)